MKTTPLETEPATAPIVVECDLPHPPSQVWRALTEQDLLGAWLLPNTLRPEAGTRFSFQEPGCSRPIDCEVLDVEPHRTLRWRQTEQGDSSSDWRPVDSVVTIELTVRADGGTHLRLVHDEFTIAGQRTIATTACATVIPLNFAKARRHVATRARAVQSVYQLRRAA
jgi:uncharacterized protein YndB with AHSA1/START domain